MKEKVRQMVRRMDEREAKERKSQQGDDRAVTVEVPSLEDAREEEDEFTSMWRKLGLNQTGDR